MIPTSSPVRKVSLAISILPSVYEYLPCQTKKAVNYAESSDEDEDVFVSMSKTRRRNRSRAVAADDDDDDDYTSDKGEAAAVDEDGMYSSGQL